MAHDDKSCASQGATQLPVKHLIELRVQLGEPEHLDDIRCYCFAIEFSPKNANLACIYSSVSGLGVLLDQHEKNRQGVSHYGSIRS